MTDTAWHAKAEAILDDCIAAQKTITYAELAARAGIPSPHRIHKLTTWLEEIMERDAAAGARMRAAAVVSRVDGKPARGYFEKLAALAAAGCERSDAPASRNNKLNPDNKA